MEKSHKKDIIGNILLVIVIALSIAWIFDNQMYYSLVGAIISIITVIIYTRRILSLSDGVKTPITDTLISLSGINITLYLFNPIINSSLIGGLSPVYSIYLLIIGIVGKTMLLDRVILEFFEKIRDGIIYIIDWSSNEIINLVRSLLGIVSLLLLFFRDTIDVSIGIKLSLAIAILCISVVILLSSRNKWNGNYFVVRFFDFLLSIYLIQLFIAEYEGIERLSGIFLSFSLFIWSFSIPAFIEFSTKSIQKITYYLRTYTLRSIQVIAFGASFIVLYFGSTNPILYTQIPLNVLLFILLIIFAFHNFIYSALIIMYPYLRSLIQWVYNQLNTIDKILPFIAVALLFIPNKIDTSNYITISIYVLSAILFAFSWNGIIMVILDSIIFGFVSFLYFFIRIFNSIIRFFGFSGIIDLLTKFFRVMINWFIVVLKWIIRNIILISLWLVALFFVLLGIGLILPSLFPISSIIFVNIIENTLIRWIIALFLMVIGVLTFKEVTSRRNKFRLGVYE